jgi:hypothetical protein
MESWEGFDLPETKAELAQIINEIEAEFDLIKNDEDYPFPLYTVKKIKDLKGKLLVDYGGSGLLLASVMNDIMVLKKIHLKKELTLENILVFASSGTVLDDFMSLRKYMSDKEYWESLGSSYVENDYNPKSLKTLQKLFSSSRNFKEDLMDEDEKIYFSALPEKVKIYRGMSLEESKSKEYKISWTLDKSVADIFVQRNSLLYKPKVFIVENLEVNKSDLLCYFNGRNEHEVIYLSQ